MAEDDQLVQTLLKTNARLTEQLVTLATEIIRQKVGLPAAETLIPSFDDFSKDLSDAERLFYSEEEEDDKYLTELQGGQTSDPQLTKEILEAAGHHDLAAQITAN